MTRFTPSEIGADSEFNCCCAAAVLLFAGDLKGPDAPSVELEAGAPDVKAEGGSLTGKVAAGTAAVGAALGAGVALLSGKGSGKANVTVRFVLADVQGCAQKTTTTHTRDRKSNRPPTPCSLSRAVHVFLSAGAHKIFRK